MNDHMSDVPPQVTETGETESFKPGDSVIYGLHGKCAILSLEQRHVGAETVSFYKLEKLRNTIAKPTKPEPAIWVPVSQALTQGMRSPLSRNQFESIQKILSSKEYYFNLTETWTQIQPKLEASIRNEGAAGLAKVVSFLFVLKKRQVVPSPEVSKYAESVNRILFREISELTGETMKTAEEAFQKAARGKLTLDQ